MHIQKPSNREDWAAAHGLVFFAMDAGAMLVPALRIWPLLWLVWSHLRGYPPGPSGAVLAGIFALGLGWLRIFTGGLALPVLVHVAADATIYILVARIGVFGGMG